MARLDGALSAHLLAGPDALKSICGVSGGGRWRDVRGIAGVTTCKRCERHVKEGRA